MDVNVSSTYDESTVDTPTFDLETLPYSVKCRFIELLKPVSYSCFMRTSKENYKHCLNYRGIECSYMYIVDNEVTISFYILDRCNLSKPMADKWMRYFVIVDELTIRGTQEQILPHVKKYKRLFVENYPKTNNGLYQLLGKLIHPNLERVLIGRKGTCNKNAPCQHYSTQQMKTLASMFDNCKSLERFTFYHTCHDDNIKTVSHFEDVIKKFIRRQPKMEWCFVDFNNLFKFWTKSDTD